MHRFTHLISIRLEHWRKARVTEVIEGEETDVKSEDGYTEEVTTEVVCVFVQVQN